MWDLVKQPLEPRRFSPDSDFKPLEEYDENVGLFRLFSTAA